MSYKLDPRILSKLRAFAARRRKLIIVRGVAAAFAMLLATMLLVAVIDARSILPDEVRWGLSGAAYLTVIVAVWRTCLRLLAHAPSPRMLARLVEHAEPKLREDLISAVELGTPENETVLDSPRFRELLQQDVAARMEGMEMEQLLPVHLVRRYLTIASVILVGVIAAFFGTNFKLGTLMLRALLPGANLARVSKTQVEVLGPNPAETLVPFGDAVPLLVKISGAPAREAWLETFTEAEGRQKVKLTPLGKGQFSGTIQVGREDLRYRVRAGDAITKKYLLDAESRPYVAKFTKTYTMPAYAKAAPRTVTEDSGDLVALEGTEVELTLETNQPVKAAELRLDQSAKDITALPLRRRPDGKLTGKVSLKTSGSYRVHLVAESTGFENKFSPEYELRAEADLVPQIEIDLPKQDLILPANDLVDIVGHASDDIGIARIEQHIRVNEGGWKRVPLLEESGLKAVINHRWDLYQQGVKAGDLITTKLVAFDFKGNRGESRPLQITVTAAGVEMKRLESLDALVALDESLKLWRQSVDALAKASSDARQRFEQTGENDLQRPASLTALWSAQVEFERQHTETATVLANAIRTSQPGHQSADLVLMGRQIAKTESGTARQGKIGLSIVAADPTAAFGRDVMREADDAFNRAAQRARMVEDGFRTLLNSEEADLLAENAQIVQREQERLGEVARSSGDDANAWAALGARIRVVLSETKSLEDILARLGERGLNGSDRAKQLAKELKKQREVVDKTIAEKGLTKDLLTPAANLTETMTRVERSALDLRGDLLHRPLQVIKEERQDVQPAWSNFEKLVNDLEIAERNASLPEPVRAAMKKARWELRRDSFKTTGDLEEIRPHSDAPFVGDVRSVTVAIQALQTLAASDSLVQTRDKIRVMDRAFRLLEGVHDLQELYDGLGVEASTERWQVETARARTLAPRDWGWLESRLRTASDDLGKLELRDEPLRGAINGAQKILLETLKLPAFRDIDQEMGQRRRTDFQPSSRQMEAETLAAGVKRAIDYLRPEVEAARQQIAQMTPKLSEYAQALAKEAEEQKTETQKQEEAAKSKTPDQAKSDAQKALADQKQLSDKVETLKDLLRADANQQNIMQADQRERARDADDALAMLKDPPPKAENALQDAARAETKSSWEQALAQAAEQQQKLQQALNQIGKHYEALEQGKSADETRVAMREAEQDLGIKQALDQQYEKAAQLAQMAQQTPQDLLKQLEQALPQNPLMQQELSTISQNTLAEAQQKLSTAANTEKQVAKNIDQLANQQQQGNAPETAQQAAMSAEQAAKEAAQAAQAARQAADDAVQTAKQAKNDAALNQARQARQQAQDAAQAAEKATQSAHEMAAANQSDKIAQAAQATAQKATEVAQKAEQATNAAKQAQASAEKAAQQANAQQGNNQQSAQRSADAATSAEQATKAATQAEAAAQQALAMSQAPTPTPQTAQNNAANAPTPDAQNGQAQAAAQSPPVKQNPLLANSAQQQQGIAQAATQAAADVSRAGRHEERLQNRQTGQKLQQLGAEIGETAVNEVPAAQKALNQVEKASQAQQPVQAAAQELTAEAAKVASAQGNANANAQPTGDTAQSSQQAPAAAQQSASAPSPQAAQNAPNAPPANAQSSAKPAMVATPQEQTWMARTLDILDAALNSSSQETSAAQAGQQPAQGPQPAQPGQQGQPAPQGQPGQPQPGPGQPGQTSAERAMAQAQAAMQQAAQATQQSMAQSRSQEVSPTPGALNPKGDQQAKSMAGANAQSPETAHGALPDAKGLKNGEWGKLPKQMAEQLSRGQNEAVAAEYRNQVETYYRVIAERAKAK